MDPFLEDDNAMEAVMLNVGKTKDTENTFESNFSEPSKQEILNDVHSQLNATRVKKLVSVTSEDQLIDLIKKCRKQNRSIAVSGARGAMGGQQFSENKTVLDLRGLNNILWFDVDKGLVKAQAGINWTDLIEWLNHYQLEKFGQITWGISQKQTGGDFMTLGGSLSANAHGRGLLYGPIVQDVAEIEIINSSGDKIKCSRDKNQKLFNLVIGGYGLFGCILTVTLKLSYKQRLKRQVDVTNLSRLPELFQEKIKQGCLYGDFQFSCDHQNEDFLSKGVFSTYLPVENSGEEVDEQSQFKLSEQDWEQLLYLAHVDKAEAFKQYSEFYLSTNNQLYWSDTHQLSVYLNGYHESLDKKMGAKHKCSEMISEFYVESEKFNEFITRAKSYMKTNSVDLIYGTVRLIKEDRQTFLPWANKNYER